MSNTSTTSPGPARSFASIVKLLIGVVIVGGLFMVAISGHNRANNYEKRLDATWNDNQNILGQYALKMGEAAQIPERYANDFKDLVKAEMEGRYGDPKDRKVLSNWVKERQLNFDSSVYTRLYAMIEAGHNDFQNAQTRLLDIKREYETALDNWPGGWFMKVWGYPSDLSKYKVVTTQDVKDSFGSGIAKPIDMFPKN